MASPRFDPVINVNWHAMARIGAFWRAIARFGARDLAKGLPLARDFCFVARRRAWPAWRAI